MSVQDGGTGDDNMAAEFVLGLLAPSAMAEAERRLITDAAFARAVDVWRERLAAFDDTAEPIEPSPPLWGRIERSTLAAATHGAQRSRPWHGLWNSLWVWRAATAGAAALALLFAVTSLVSIRFARDVAARKPVLVAILVGEGNQAGAVVNAFANGRVELVPLRDVAVPAGRALQVWTLWDRAVGPRSVGLIERARTIRLDLDALPPPGPDQLFEITLEPAAGSPTGRPTGPVLYKGNTARTL
jgi:anti-sigma-K factor RskA